MSIQLQNRLKRIKGQLDSLQNNISSQTACADVIPQFLAIKGAMNAAFELYVKESLAECSSADSDKRDQLITMLIRK